MIVFIRARIQIRNPGIGGVGGREKWKRKGKQTSLELISLNVHNCCPEISRLQSPLKEWLYGFTIIQNLLMSVLPALSSCTSDNPVVSQTPFWALPHLGLVLHALRFAISWYTHRVVTHPRFPPCPSWFCDRALGNQQLDGMGCNREQLSEGVVEEEAVGSRGLGADWTFPIPALFFMVIMIVDK